MGISVSNYIRKSAVSVYQQKYYLYQCTAGGHGTGRDLCGVFINYNIYTNP